MNLSKNSLAAFLVAFFLIPLIDYVWLGLLMADFYKAQLGSIARFTPEGTFDPILWPAALVYVFLALGVLLFAIPQAGPQASWKSLAQSGFAFGVVVYGVYDFTNLSLVRDWPLAMSFVDVIWGGVLCALVSLAVAPLLKRGK